MVDLKSQCDYDWHVGISCEPLLECLDIGLLNVFLSMGDVEWVIVGGENGPQARPMPPEACDYLEEACRRNNVPYFFKGFGSNFHGVFSGRCERRELPEEMAAWR
jgi:protein gp37